MSLFFDFYNFSKLKILRHKLKLNNCLTLYLELFHRIIVYKSVHKI